ncbi:hypothetical protein S83_054400 [Arachis hypogaea]
MFLYIDAERNREDRESKKNQGKVVPTEGRGSPFKFISYSLWAFVDLIIYIKKKRPKYHKKKNVEICFNSLGFFPLELNKFKDLASMRVVVVDWLEINYI